MFTDPLNIFNGESPPRLFINDVELLTKLPENLFQEIIDLVIEKQIIADQAEYNEKVKKFLDFHDTKKVEVVAGLRVIALVITVLLEQRISLDVIESELKQIGLGEDRIKKIISSFQAKSDEIRSIIAEKKPIIAPLYSEIKWKLVKSVSDSFLTKSQRPSVLINLVSMKRTGDDEVVFEVHEPELKYLINELQRALDHLIESKKST